MKTMMFALALTTLGCRAPAPPEPAHTTPVASASVPAPSDAAKPIVSIAAGPTKLFEVVPGGAVWCRGKMMLDPGGVGPALEAALVEAQAWAVQHPEAAPSKK